LAIIEVKEARMAVKKVGEKYRCNVCGNEVTVTKVGGGTLVCCGQDMELVSSEGFKRGKRNEK
jgi:desulfoferrodoxin-like iron-binding protein